MRICVIRGRDLGRLNKFAAPFHHLLMVVFSVIGIVGAVLQIIAIDKLDFALFDRAKSLRIASGALFISASAWVIIAPPTFAFLFRDRIRRAGHRVALPAIMLTICGCSLMLESVYRVLAATKIDGFILEPYSVGVLLVLPEFIIIFVFIVFDLDDLGNVTLYRPKRETQEDPEMSGNADRVGATRDASGVQYSTVSKHYSSSSSM